MGPSGSNCKSKRLLASIAGLSLQDFMMKASPVTNQKRLVHSGGFENPPGTQVRVRWVGTHIPALFKMSLKTA